MTTVNLNIDGHEIVAEEGLTIREVAKRAEIKISTLCFIPDKLKDSPCDICVVEIGDSDEFQRSCEIIATDGMVVHIGSDRGEHRQNQLAVLGQTHFGDCKTPCNQTYPGQINDQGYIIHVEKGRC